VTIRSKRPRAGGIKRKEKEGGGGEGEEDSGMEISNSGEGPGNKGVEARYNTNEDEKESEGLKRYADRKKENPATETRDPEGRKGEKQDGTARTIIKVGIAGGMKEWGSVNMYVTKK